MKSNTALKLLKWLAYIVALILLGNVMAAVVHYGMDCYFRYAFEGMIYSQTYYTVIGFFWYLIILVIVCTGLILKQLWDLKKR